MKKIILLLFLGTIFLSCSLFKNMVYLDSEVSKAVISGKVISEEGLPLEGVRVKLSTENSNISIKETVTDINGVFLYKSIGYGKYKLTGEKYGFTIVEYFFEYNFKNRKKIPPIKIKLLSFNFIINEGFEYLKEKNFEKALECLDQAKKINSLDEVVSYLEAMYYYEFKDFNTAMKLLEDLKERDRKNIYYKLTLIDIYDRLDLFEKEIDLCLYIGREESKKYIDYIKIAAYLYKDKFNNQEEYEKLLKEYNELIKTRNNE